MTDGPRSVHVGRFRTRRRLLAAVLIAAFVAVYALVLALYAVSSNTETQQFPPTQVDEIAVGVEPTEVQATAGVIHAMVTILPPSRFLDDSLALTSRIDVVMPNADGNTVTFPKGVVQLSAPVKLRPEQNDFQHYPLDTYQVSWLVLGAYAVAEDGRRAEIPSQVAIGDLAPGWVTTASDDGQGMALRRSGATVTTVGILLLALIALTAAALLVARAVVTGRRRIEATMASWLAAMLFAVIPLRLNMPGSPAMGVWIDFAVVLWVEIGLLFSLGVFITAWLRFSPAGHAVQPDPGLPRSTGAG